MDILNIINKSIVLNSCSSSITLTHNNNHGGDGARKTTSSNLYQEKSSFTSPKENPISKNSSDFNKLNLDILAESTLYHCPKPWRSSNLLFDSSEYNSQNKISHSHLNGGAVGLQRSQSCISHFSKVSTPSTTPSLPKVNTLFHLNTSVCTTANSGPASAPVGNFRNEALNKYPHYTHSQSHYSSKNIQGFDLMEMEELNFRNFSSASPIKNRTRSASQPQFQTTTSSDGRNNTKHEFLSAYNYAVAAAANNSEKRPSPPTAHGYSNGHSNNLAALAAINQQHQHQQQQHQQQQQQQQHQQQQQQHYRNLKFNQVQAHALIQKEKSMSSIQALNQLYKEMTTNTTNKRKRDGFQKQNCSEHNENNKASGESTIANSGLGECKNDSEKNYCKEPREPTIPSNKRSTKEQQLSNNRTGDGFSSSHSIDQSKRLSHIAAEQKRRQNINEGFDGLKKYIPSCKNSCDSKAVVLKKAIIYIRHLQNELKQQQQHQQNHHHQQTPVQKGEEKSSSSKALQNSSYVLLN